ncbi:protein lethal(2)essential for life-like [Onthophagus taurus]|uniref:protein lethal(2)essential for life-like n=1 Tax=Onthophagus taurus TaxID=166361 RepID=UPI000C209CD7|nr:protein lethal(2)essential for life-like [Onthophagus taurus]
MRSRRIANQLSNVYKTKNLRNGFSFKSKTQQNQTNFHFFKINLNKMSLVPMLFRDWWDDFEINRPSRLLDQQFGLGLRRDDLLNSLSLRTSRYLRPWTTNTTLTRQDSGSTIANEKDKFQVILDVQQFAPGEITVKTNNNSIVVEGKHEEKQDEHGYISRHFVRRYILPCEFEINDVVSSLSSDGILTVTAPKKGVKVVSGERIVPITQTGPAKPTVTPVVESPQPKIEHPA